MLLPVLIINIIIIFVGAFNLPDNQTSIESKSTNFIFESPNVVKEYTREDGTSVKLDAYKTSQNEALTTSGQFSGLRWVSIGKPEIVKTNDQGLFQMQNKISFSLRFEMLTNRDKEVLADEVKRAKGFTVDPSQFSDIDPNTIECSIELYDLKDQKIVQLKGKVFGLRESPYELEFKYPIGTKERNLFEEEIKSDPVDLKFKCSITAGAQLKKSNTFTITLQESNNIKLSEKLFGPANESFVTRDQLTELSNEVNSNFNVVEDYQIPQDQFSSAFVQDIISLSGQTTFNPVSFDEALKSLSKYSLDFSEDLKPDVITKELSEIFKIEQTGDKSHIIFDEAYYKELEKESASSGSKTCSVQLFGQSGSKTSQYAQSQKDKWIDQGTSLNDQLKELNSYSENQIKYEFEGNKIVPKSIQVSKLQSSSFKKTLSFNRIKNIYYEADFNKVFTLNTVKHTTKKESKYPNYSIVMLGSQDQLKYFDSNGKGFDEYTGWYLCDGRNGAPDLRGRVAVGTHPNLSDYTKIGTSGGNEKVTLTEAQMPHHTHRGFLIYLKSLYKELTYSSRYWSYS
jgi:hypothetical protein